MNTLCGNVAVNTGGNSSIGYATAKEFVAKGARVVVITGTENAARRWSFDTEGKLAEACPNLRYLRD